MIKKIVALSVVVTAVAGVFFGGAFVSAADVSVAPGESIQAAINSANAGDVITVAPGSYSGPINVTKSVTLRGAQAGVDARDRTGAETIITSEYSGGFNIQSPGVVIDGFTIDGSAASVYGRAFVLAGATDVSNLTVSNNIIKNNQTGLTTAAAGVNVSNMMVNQNLFVDNNYPTAAAGIFVANAVGSGLQIINNDFSNTDDGGPGSSNAISLSGTDLTPLSSIVVEGNTSINDGAFIYVYNANQVAITNNTSSNQVGNGVLVGNNVDGLIIKGNTLTDSNNGVRFSGTTTPANNVTISDNTITGMATAGVLVGSGAVGSEIAVTGNTITNNASGITNEGTVAIDANNNWWGCQAGPGANGCDTITGVVLASSWYVNDSFTTTNLDADDVATVPGVPNTSWVNDRVGLVAAALIGAAAFIVSVAVVYRRHSISL